MRYRPLFPLIVVILAILSCTFGLEVSTPIPLTAGSEVPPTSLPSGKVPATGAPPEPTAAPAATTESGIQMVPQRALSTSGPWVLLESMDALWAINSDGTGLTKMFSLPPYFELGSASPAGRLVSFVSSSDEIGNTGRILQLLELPSGAVRTVTALTIPSTEPGPETEFGDPTYDITVVAGDNAWSPDGSLLAFISAQDGPSADLYVYAIDDETIERLTDGPSQAYSLSWSPDGDYIVHMGVSGFGTGAGYGMVAVWAASADGSQVNTLYEPRGGDERILGWSSTDTFVAHGWSAGCASTNVRAINLEGKIQSVYFIDFFSSAAFDPESGVVAVAVDRYVADCNPDGSQGVFLTAPQSAPRLLLEGDYSQIEWSENAGLFFARSAEEIQAFTPGGSLVQIQGGLADFPAVALGGGRWAWIEQDSRSLRVGTANNPGMEVYPGPVAGPDWSPDGETLFFRYGNSLLAATAPDFIPLVVTDHMFLTEVDVPGSP